MTSRERVGALLGFTALAAYSSWHWFALVADPPPWRWAACVAIALGVGVALNALGALRGRRIAVSFAIAAALAVAAVAAGLMATGVSVRLLAPAGWSELGGELDAGLAGISQVELPYDGKAAWTRLGILLAAPAVLAIATAIAFWPGRGEPRVRRAVAVVLLVALYGVAVTWESPGAEPARGLGLLICVAAFLWLGRFPARRTLAAATAVLVAGLVALPAAAGVSTTDPAINYANWRLFGAERTATFDWNHSYGPLDWPQRGTELFEVRGTQAPLYWKTSVLDSFDGVAWSRGEGVAALAGPDPSLDDLEGASEEMIASEERWLTDVEISVLGLRSPLLVTTGITRQVEGVDVTSSAEDGTTRLAPPGLVAGDSYTVSSYVPNPSASLLKRRDDGSYPAELERYTTLLLPQGRDSTGLAPDAAPVNPLVFVRTPLRGVRRTTPASLAPEPKDLLANTPYEGVRALALRLTRDAPGNYEAVAAVKRYLLENYTYEQEVPERRDPLPAFLFRDRAGYCQQFSGAMALMLRLAGIPSRVVSGFAPGLPDRDAGAFVVRDTDAHSWVEVWFPRVGWVTVDPTPSAAPARTEVGLTPSSASNPAAAGLGRAFEIEESAQSGPSRGGSGTGAREEADSPLRGFLALLGLVSGAALFHVYRRRRRLLLSPDGAESQLRELERVLPLVGGRASPSVTLLSMERQLSALGRDAVSYPAALRANRYRRGRPRRPGPRERRRLRRAIARAGGPSGWMRALLAIPPGGPRR